MIKRILLCGAVSVLLLLSGCGFASIETENCHFECLKGSDDCSIYVHKETGVIYVFMHIGTQHTGFCPMIKADGTAYTIEDYEMENNNE